MRWLALAVMCCALYTPVLSAQSGDRIVGYFAAWGGYARNFHVPDIPADEVTHINYAFANVVGGQCVLRSPVTVTRQL